ncbi:hypothetical protein [Candidatus Binatus sp.]|uniref:hypothetical protein n=1 Tax=Candidatus Binatus sp. TaxID=2811406 RepID=UPI003C8A2B37
MARADCGRFSPAKKHHLNILALESNHLRCRVCASRRIHGFARRDQTAVFLEPLALGPYLFEFDGSHRMLERPRFKRATIDDRLAVGVFVDTVSEGFFRFIRTKLEPPFAR